MAFGLVTRILARLLAMGALCGAWILLLICSIGVPVRDFSFLTTTFQDGSIHKLGIWGSCYYQGASKVCTATKLGYQTIASTLPQYAQNPGAPVNITEKPLTAALIWFPLAAGSTSLANLLSLVPIRFVTLLTIALTFLSIGAQAIAFCIALAAFVRAQGLMKASFSPIGFAQPKLGECLWMSISALVVTVGAFLFLMVALEPAKTKEGKASDYGNTYNSGAGDPRYSGEKYAPERAASIRGTSRASQLGAADRTLDSRKRRSSRRRHHDDYEDEYETGGRRSHRRSSRYESGSDLSDEESPVRRPRRTHSQRSARSAGSRRSRRDYADSDEEGTAGDFTTRRTGSRVQAY